MFDAWAGSQAMARRGRKRKAGRRYPSGRLKQKPREVEERVRIARAQPHRRELRSNLRVDEMATDPLGRMRLKGILSEPQYLAGCRYAVVVGQYRATIEAPRATAGSGRGFDCCQGLDTDCECLARRRRYDRAYIALHDAGRRALIAVNHVAVHNRELVALELVYLLAGLTALAKHFALTERRPRGSVEMQTE